MDLIKYFQDNSDTKNCTIIGIVAALFFLPFLGGVHLFDWDEINFAEISREMMVLGDYLRVHVNFQPFWEKPPFFFWLQVISMHAFGVGEYAARFPNAICGVVTLIILYLIGKRLYDKSFGVLWALAYLGSVLPFLYFKSGIIDPWFNLFIFGGLYGFILFFWKKEKYEAIQLQRSPMFYLFMGGFVLGFGMITKGQTAFIILGLCLFVYWVLERFRFYVSVPQFLFFTLATSLVTLGWYGLETLKNGPWFVVEFTKYQYKLFSTPDAGHVGFPGYHFAINLVGCFPASIFAIRALFKIEQEYAYQRNFRKWMIILFWVVLILFTIVQSKIVHYSSMVYFPLTYLAALTLYKVIRKEIQIPRWAYIGLGVIGGLFVLATVSLPFIAMHPEMIKPLFDDPFAVANLDADINWTGLEIIPGILLLGVLIWTFILFRKQNFSRATSILFMGNAVFIFLTLIFFIKKIEGYSQRPAIAFFERLRGQDVYATTDAFKSYAHLFYFQRPATDQHPQSHIREWLLGSDEIDKDVYVVTKINKAHQLRARGTFEEIGRENGFVFFKRSPASQQPVIGD